MNSKQLNIVLGIVVVALLGLVGYMALNRTPEISMPNCEEISLDEASRIDISENVQIVHKNGKIYICPKESANLLQPLDYQESVSNVEPGQSEETANWKTYTNKAGCFSIKYNNPYRVWLEYNLVNYNGDDPKYEMGNPNGVKIQVQPRTLNGQTFSEALAEINKNIEASGTDFYETKVQKYSLGNIQYMNKTLNGPGGAFDVFYAPFKDSKGYYAILVWHIQNDQKTVNSILSTFTPQACSINQ